MFELVKKKNKHIVQLYRVTKAVKENHVNLLILFGKGKIRNHYCYIKNLSALLSSQIMSKRCKKYFCDSFLSRFSSEEKKNVHIRNGNCLRREVIFPEKYPFSNFQNYQNQMKLRFTIYADIECILKPIASPQNVSQRKSIETHEHVPCSYAYNIACDDSVSFEQKLRNIRLYRGEDCMKKLISSLREDVQYIYNTYMVKKEPMQMTDAQKASYAEAISCHICKRRFPPNLGDKLTYRSKVRDHDHITGEYRNAACNDCNLKYQEPKFVPIYFHNLNYDASCFIKELGKFKADKLTVLPLNKEKYISFSQKVIANRKQTVR